MKYFLIIFVVFIAIKGVVRTDSSQEIAEELRQQDQQLDKIYRQLEQEKYQAMSINLEGILMDIE